MIARVWTARSSIANADAYRQHLCDRVLPLLRDVRGYEGVTLLERPEGDHVEIIVLTWWHSLEAIRTFAGANLNCAVVADEARALLQRCDGAVRHFDVTLGEPSEAPHRRGTRGVE